MACLGAGIRRSVSLEDWLRVDARVLILGDSKTGMKAFAEKIKPEWVNE